VTRKPRFGTTSITPWLTKVSIASRTGAFDVPSRAAIPEAE
jgi:hypothetical protein